MSVQRQIQLDQLDLLLEQRDQLVQSLHLSMHPLCTLASTDQTALACKTHMQVTIAISEKLELFRAKASLVQQAVHHYGKSRPYQPGKEHIQAANYQAMTQQQKELVEIGKELRGLLKSMNIPFLKLSLNSFSSQLKKLSTDHESAMLRSLYLAEVGINGFLLKRIAEMSELLETTKEELVATVEYYCTVIDSFSKERALILIREKLGAELTCNEKILAAIKKRIPAEELPGIEEKCREARIAAASQPLPPAFQALQAAMIAPPPKKLLTREEKHGKASSTHAIGTKLRKEPQPLSARSPTQPSESPAEVKKLARSPSSRPALRVTPPASENQNKSNLRVHGLHKAPVKKQAEVPLKPPPSSVYHLV